MTGFKPWLAAMCCTLSHPETLEHSDPVTPPHAAQGVARGTTGLASAPCEAVFGQ